MGDALCRPSKINYLKAKIFFEEQLFGRELHLDETQESKKKHFLDGTVTALLRGFALLPSKCMNYKPFDETNCCAISQGLGLEVFSVTPENRCKTLPTTQTPPRSGGGGVPPTLFQPCTIYKATHRHSKGKA